MFFSGEVPRARRIWVFKFFLEVVPSVEPADPLGTER